MLTEVLVFVGGIVVGCILSSVGTILYIQSKIKDKRDWYDY